MKLDPITYEAALARAWNDLRGKDPAELSELAGGHLGDEGIELPFMGEMHIVDLGGERVTAGGNEVPSFISVLVLHYLAGCGGEKPTGRYLSFREIPGGEMYYSAFKGRAIDRLASSFGENSSLLFQAGEPLGAGETMMGDVSIEVRPFPMLVLAVVVWEGDDEVPPSANILFDSTVVRMLPMEDLSVVGNLVASRLVGNLGEIGDRGEPEVEGRG